MDFNSIGPLLIEYRYWILIPLSIIEGPIAAFAAGSLASLGYFNIVVLAIFFFARDMIMDGIYYAIGHYGGKTAWVQRVLHRVGVREGHLDEVRRVWEAHPARTMFLGKLSYGLAQAFIIAAGTVRMSLTTFFRWGAVVAIAQYGILLALGYYLGDSFGGTVAGILHNLQYVLLGGSIVVIAYYGIAFYLRRKALEATKEDMP
jgi:membrane protein DedA with SNARE-associated domain